MLLASLEYTKQDAAEKFLRDIAAMEQSLRRLEEQEQKYSAELDAALNEYDDFRSRHRHRALTRCSCMRQGRTSAPTRSRKRRTGSRRVTARSTARF